jgi:hypothetical protein
VSADDPIATAIAEWQRKHRVADDDPLIAVLELVRLHLQHARVAGDDPDSAPPGFEDFRGTIELLDGRSKAFIHQASDLISELRRFGLNVQRINRARVTTQIALVVLGIIVGGLAARLL